MSYEVLPSSKRPIKIDKAKNHEIEREFVEHNLLNNINSKNVQKEEIPTEIDEEAVKRRIEEANKLELQNKNIELQNRNDQLKIDNQNLDEKLRKINQELNNYKYNSVYQNTNEMKKLQEENERLKDDYNNLKEKFDKINTQNAITQKQIQSVQKSQIAVYKININFVS